MNLVKYLYAIAFILVLMISSMAAIPENAFDYDIRVHNYDAILCEPLPVRILITYRGNEAIEAYDYPKELYINNEKIENSVCEMIAHNDKAAAIGKYIIKPGQSITLIDNLRCFSPFWKPGKYDVHYKVKINQELTLITPSFRITVSEPTGIDKKVFDAGKADYSPKYEYCIRDKSGFCKKDLWNPCTYNRDPQEFLPNISKEEIAFNYPTSRYAAWIFGSEIFDPIIDDPHKIAIDLKKYNGHPLGGYPSRDAVWDPTVKGKIRNFSDDKKYATWTKDKALEVIRICPYFPDKDKLIVAAGICSIVIGNDLEGVEMMKKLIHESNSKDAMWAKQFLEEWEKQKTKL